MTKQTILATHSRNDVSKKLFHLYIKGKGIHKYYGSLQAIFDDKNYMGVSKYTLDRYDFKKPFENDYVELRKGRMLSTGDVRKKKPVKKQK